MRRPCRAFLLALALVPIGTIGGHLAGYGLAGSAALEGSHSHLRPAGWVAAAVALVALGWVAAAPGPRRHRVRVGWLAAGQAGLFFALEAAEHALAGHGLRHLLAEPALRWGLAAQVVTATALVLAALVARASGDRVRALLTGKAGRQPARRHALPARPAAAAPRSLLLAACASPRAPPPVLGNV